MADTSFQQEFLYTHNSYRSKHSAPPMTLSEELNASAQKWADHLLKINALKHSGGQDGENIYFMSSSVKIKLTGKEAVDSWYDEVKNYNWSNPGFSSNTGHFTQVVWKDSTELGVGMATDDRRIFVVGQYRQRGNVSRYFEKNVLPLASFQQEFLDTHNAYRSEHNTPPMTLSKEPKNVLPLASFEREFLDTHNAYRSKHNTSPLTLSKELTASAQKWADYLLETNALEHSDIQDGENIYSMSSTATIELTGKEAVDEWYSEVKNYNWSIPEFRSNTGHFTQVVWKDSKELGVGMATNGKRVVVVGQYRPRGNMMRDFKNNVLPLA